MHPRIKLVGPACLLLRWWFVAGGCMLVAAVALSAQSGPTPPKPTAAQASSDYRLSVDVDLVVLHTAVVDLQGRLVTQLRQEHFRVYEDNVAQKIALFRQEDTPLTLGLVIDNSASMRHVKQHLTTGALTFVETSNPADEVFVLNFNDDYYLDLPLGRDFTSSIEELKEALARTETRGSTALWNALRAALEHAKRGTRRKKVLLTITDGLNMHNAPIGFEQLLRYAQQSEIAIYFVMLPPEEDERSAWRSARRRLLKLAEVTGGEVHFPESLEQVEPICRKIAQDIRSQYVLAYYPSNRARDGTYRTVRVDVRPPKGSGPLTVRTRTGYYAPRPEGAGSNGP